MAGVYPTKYEPVDWHKANDFMSTTAANQRDSSDCLRQQSTTLRNATNNRAAWSEYESKKALQDRASDVEQWKEGLETCLGDLEKEIDSLDRSKDAAEMALREKATPLDAVVECLTLRENRVDIDQVRDNVETQLHKELEVVEGCKALLNQKLIESYGQLGALQEARHQLQLDIADKGAAHNLDSECIKLDGTSQSIGLWRNSTRVEKGTVTPQTWDSFSNYNTLRAQAEMKSSATLRDAISHTIAQTYADLQAQHRTTNFAFRRRLHETKQTRDNLAWQQKNTADEMARVEQEVASLSGTLGAKHVPMMVAQTRLEARTQRPNVELCRDQAQAGLISEVDNLTGAMRALAKQLQAAQNSLARLQRTLQRVSDDIAIKDNTMDIDIHCMHIRQQSLNDCDSSLAAEFTAAPQPTGEAPEGVRYGNPSIDAGGSEVPPLGTAGSSSSSLSTAQSTARST